MFAGLEDVDFVFKLAQKLKLRELAGGEDLQGVLLVVLLEFDSVDLSEGSRADQLQKLEVAFFYLFSVIEPSSNVLKFITLYVHYQI